MKVREELVIRRVSLSWKGSFSCCDNEWILLQCGPCREFTPKLIETYNKLKEDGKNFEIVFASSDENAKGFEDYYKDMPWLAFPLNDHRAGALDEHFKVYGKYYFRVEENLSLNAPLDWAFWEMKLASHSSFKLT